MKRLRLLKSGVTLAALGSLAVGVPLSAASAADPAAAAGKPNYGKTCPTGKHYAPMQNKCVPNGLKLGHRQVHKGDTETIRVIGFKAGSTIQIRFDSTNVGSLTAPGNTVANGSFKVPGNVAPGLHRVTVTGVGQNGQLTTKTITVRVLANGSMVIVKSAVTQPLRGASGGELAALAGAGFLLLGGGPTAVRIARRRRASV